MWSGHSPTNNLMVHVGGGRAGPVGGVVAAVFERGLVADRWAWHRGVRAGWHWTMGQRHP
jgi:hypothetical protein